MASSVRHSETRSSSPGGHLLGADPQLAQQDQQRRRRVERRALAVPVQVDEQVGIRIAVADQRGHVQGERRLSAAGHAVDHRDRRPVRDRLLDRADQPVDGLLAAGEVAHRTRKAPHPGRRRRFVAGRPTLENLLVNGLQLAAGVEAELVAQHLAGPPVLGQRVRLPPGPVERHHQLPAQPLPQREPLHQPGQLAEQVPLVAGGQFQIHPVLGGHHPALVEHRGRPPDLLTVDLRERRAPPQVERLPQQRRIAPLPGLRDQPGEHRGVQFVRSADEPVAGRLGLDRARRQQPAQPGDAGLQLAARGGRRIVAPDRVDQLAGAQHPIGVQQQHGQHHPVPAGGDRVAGHGQRTEDPVADHRRLTATSRGAAPAYDSTVRSRPAVIATCCPSPVTDSGPTVRYRNGATPIHDSVVAA